MFFCKVLQNLLPHAHIFSKKTRGDIPRLESGTALPDLVSPENLKLEAFRSFFLAAGPGAKLSEHR